MHIPDGYLSPQTYLPVWAVMAAYWAAAFHRVRTRLSTARLPLLGVGAAFTFVVMMFNVPIPGGTSGHAVGAGLLAILLGPVAASVAVTVALVIQALVFGDGGVTAIAANCFAIAVVGPFVSWGSYRMLTARSAVDSKRRVMSGAVASYLGLNASAFVVGVLFGIQPLVARTAEGQPLYAPYPLAIALPAMMAEHLLLFGFVEAAVTAAALKWIQRTEPALLTEGVTIRRRLMPEPAQARSYRTLWLALAVLAVLTPLGLVVPALLGGGTAWGEWSAEELQRSLGYVPAGMQRLGEAWTSLMPDYALPGVSGMLGESLGYVLAAVVGIGATAVAVRILSLGLRPRPRPAPPRVTAVPHHAPLPTPIADARTKDDYIGRTLASVGGSLRHAISTETIAARDGWLQRSHPAAKLLAALALIVAASLVHSLPPLIALYVTTLLVAASSRVDVWRTLRRVWLIVPLFTGAMLAPAALNIVTPGDPLFVLARFPAGAALGPLPLPPVLAVTAPGAAAAVLALFRVVASVTVVTTFVVTTRWQHILEALRALRIPSMFVIVLELCYRYFFLLAGLARDDFLARRSRTIVETRAAHGREFVAGRVVGMLRRSLRLAEQVNAAMVSRGWTGEPRTLGMRRPARHDVVLALTAIAMAAVMVVGGGFVR